MYAPSASILLPAAGAPAEQDTGTARGDVNGPTG